MRKLVDSTDFEDRLGELFEEGGIPYRRVHELSHHRTAPAAQFLGQIAEHGTQLPRFVPRSSTTTSPVVGRKVRGSIHKRFRLKKDFIFVITPKTFRTYSSYSPENELTLLLEDALAGFGWSA